MRVLWDNFTHFVLFCPLCPDMKVTLEWNWCEMDPILVWHFLLLSETFSFFLELLVTFGYFLVHALAFCYFFITYDNNCYLFIYFLEYFILCFVSPLHCLGVLQHFSMCKIQFVWHYWIYFVCNIGFVYLRMLYFFLFELLYFFS